MTDLQKFLAALFAAGALIVGAVVAGNTPPPPSTPSPTTTTSTTSVPVTTTTVVPPVGTQVWKTPATSVAIDPNSADLARRFMLGGDPSVHMGQNPANDYSLPVCYVDPASQAGSLVTSRRIYRKFSYGGAFNLNLGTRIPWSDKCKQAQGNDSFLILYDSSTGKEIDLWNVSWPGNETATSKNAACSPLAWWSPEAANIQAGLSANFQQEGGDWLCAATVYAILKPDGSYADIRTYTGNAQYASGVGLQNLAGLITPEEVASGRVTQVTKTMIANTNFGPLGTAVAPAAQYERADGGSHGSQQTYVFSDTIPEGTRFRITSTDAQIDTWLTSRGYTGRLRETARVLAVGLREYGWIISDTNGFGTNFQYASYPNNTNAWKNLGIVAPGYDLFKGLIKTSNTVALVSAWNHCADGRVIQTYCIAGSVSYSK